MTPVYDSRGRIVPLGKTLGRAGEGEVLEVCDGRNLAAKIYHALPSREKSAKLACMVSLQSERLLRLAAWPIDLLFNRPGGNVVGFLMPKAVQLSKIHDLYGVKSRLNHFPNADWRFLLHTAMNVARVFQVMQEYGFVIGDVNEGNLFVSQQATVMLLDCDSFQVISQGHHYLCEVGVENYTPPELQGKRFGDLIRTPNHDAFGLAVLLFLLLFMGKHPFAGRYQGTGDMSIGQAIKEFRFAYGAGAAGRQMRPPPASLPLEAVTPLIAELFEQAFTQVGVRARPTPAQWLSALHTLVGSLKSCDHHSGHHYFHALAACPWCKIEAASSILVFNYGKDVKWIVYTEVVETAWKQISATWPPVLPELPDVAVRSPSAWVVALRADATRGLRALVTFFNLNPQYSRAIAQLNQQLALAQARQRTLMMQWTDKANTPFWVRKKELEARKQELLSLPQQRQDKLRDLQANLRASRLTQFLDKFTIRDAVISGIGPARKQTLEAYGIETAADITESAVYSLPGFGFVYTQKMLDWRQSIEQRFVFDPNQTVSPAEITRLDASLQMQQSRLQQELVHGAAQLKQIADMLRLQREGFWKQIMEAQNEIAQVEADLKYLQRR